MARKPPLTWRLGWDRQRRDESGFTIVEVMVAVFLLLVGVLGSVSMFDGANAASGRTRAREAATNLAREVVEAARGVPYGQATGPALESQLQAQPGLGDASPSAGWQIRRRSVTYTVSTASCSIDDATDGLGQHDSGAFCGAPGGTADVNPEDYKHVTITVTWNVGQATRQVQQATVVNNPGLAAGPAITTFSQTSPASSPITSSVGSVAFALTTSTAAKVVPWSVDGAVKGNATGSGTSWSFSWPISGLYDGEYLVSAKAVDQFGLPGAPKVLTIQLNRNAPIAPTGFTGGWNGSFVEFEWLPNPERDIAGYRVYRSPSSGPPVLVCPLATDTTCRDSSPPSQTNIDYYVVAVDRDPAGDLREGAQTTKTVNQNNDPPYPPTALTATEDASGNAVLSWSAPNPPDPNNGDTIDFYRIYRDGTGYADRYDRTGYGELSFIDANTGGATHTYWISAVDNNYAESTLVGPVTP
jgi:hypothetical protein